MHLLSGMSQVLIMATQCGKLIICFPGLCAEEETRISGSTVETKTEK